MWVHQKNLYKWKVSNCSQLYKNIVLSSIVKYEEMALYWNKQKPILDKFRANRTKS
jgi:hypothetical protein